MGKFRKKPVVIEAIQIQKGNLKDIETFLAGEVLPSFYDKRSDFEINWGSGEVWIKTLEGRMLARNFANSLLEGDWVIKGVQGEFYPCRSDIFAATYEEVKDSQ